MPATAGAPSTPAAQAAAARLASMAPPAPPAPAAAPAQAVTRKEKKASKKAEKGGDGKKKKPVKPILGVLLLLVVGYVVKGKVMKPHYAPGAKVPAGEVLPLTSVTTNLSDGHLAQVTVSLQLTKPASVKQVTADEPALTATLVSDLGDQTYAGLLAPAGRAALRVELLHGFQKILGTSEGAQQVSAVYITGFVLQ